MKFTKELEDIQQTIYSIIKYMITLMVPIIGALFKIF